jgi:polysaccharide export outer membrane protein
MADLIMLPLIMTMMTILSRVRAVAVLALVVATACSGDGVPSAPEVAGYGDAPYYLIGPGDTLEIFVWQNSDLQETVLVRPDGRVTVPLIDDVFVAGRTPAEVGKEIQTRMGAFILEPHVTVMVKDISGTFGQQIRVIGEAQKPRAIPYRNEMTVLDVLIEVDGLTEFAAGNRAVIAREEQGRVRRYRVRLDDLIRNGEIDANVEMAPGDILIIPQRYL